MRGANQDTIHRAWVLFPVYGRCGGPDEPAVSLVAGARRWRFRVLGPRLGLLQVDAAPECPYLRSILGRVCSRLSGDLRGSRGTFRGAVAYYIVCKHSRR